MLLFSCAEDPPIPEEIEEVEEPEEIEEEDKDSPLKRICEFYLSQEGDDLPLFGDWEFVGFQHLETGNFNRNTCNARLAHLTHYQEGFSENMEEYYFPLYLKLSEENWIEEGDNCSGKFKMESRTHIADLHSCYSFDEHGIIEFEVGLPYWEFQAHWLTPPVEWYHNNYSNGLETATSYEIEANRLYLNYDSEVYRMVLWNLLRKRNKISIPSYARHLHLAGVAADHNFKFTRFPGTRCSIHYILLSSAYFENRNFRRAICNGLDIIKVLREIDNHRIRTKTLFPLYTRHLHLA